MSSHTESRDVPPEGGAPPSQDAARPGAAGPRDAVPRDADPRDAAVEASATQQARPRRMPPRPVTFGIIAAVVATAAIISAVTVLAARRENPTSLRPSGIPAGISTSLANVMGLEPLPGDPAPNFTLTDQAGRTMSLASLRGKVVVLEFMDPNCVDICPIVSQEFVDAYHDLGSSAGDVVFAAVNVNQYHNSVADVAAFSREHALTTIPGWHFFTGSVSALAAVWRGYHIDVQAPHPNADIIHTSAVYFIDARGREAFLASPEVDHTSKGAAYLPAGQIESWGEGIAKVAQHLAR